MPATGRSALGNALPLDDLLSRGTPGKAVWKTCPTREHSCRDMPPCAASPAEHRCCGGETALGAEDAGTGRRLLLSVPPDRSWPPGPQRLHGFLQERLLSWGQIPCVGAAARDLVGHALAGIRGARAEVQLCGDAQTPQSQQRLRKAVLFLMVPLCWGGHGKG